MAKRDKIAVFGGTFNPPHNGHLHLLEAFRRAVAFDKVLIVPAAIPPHKEVGNLASGEQRVEMCRRAFPDCEICDYEVRRGGKNYTADTLAYLKTLYPQATLYFIMGTDMFLSFASWHEPWRVVQNAVILCQKRDESVSVEQLRRFGKESLGLKEEQFLISEVTPLELSSTAVREAVESGKSIREMVPAAVAEYIEREGLYAD